MSDIHNILGKIGLSPNEMRIFEYLIRHGNSTASSVALGVNMIRTQIYVVVESLKKKGLVSEIEERGVKKYTSVDHASLVAYVANKKNEYQTLQKTLEQAASEFNSLRLDTKQKTKVSFFEGVEGIKQINSVIRRDVQKQKQPYAFRVVFSVDRMESILPGWIERNDHIYVEPFMTKYAIISQTKFLPSFIAQVKHNKQDRFHYRLWPIEQTEFPTDTLQWFNKIAYLDMRDHPSGVIIENEAITETFSMWFKLMWQSLRPTP